MSGPILGDELHPVLNKEFINEVQDKVISHIESVVENMKEDKVKKFNGIKNVLETTTSDLTKSLLDKNNVNCDIKQDLKNLSLNPAHTDRHHHHHNNTRVPSSTPQTHSPGKRAMQFLSNYDLHS